MTKKKWTIVLVVCVALCCLLGLYSCKRQCEHVTTSVQVTIEPTCTATGVGTVYCDECDAFVRYETINALGHDCSVLLSETPAACLNTGSKTFKCSRCEVTDVVTLDALGHDYSVLVGENASTCTVQGEKTYKCSRCESTTVTKSDIEPSAHNYGEWTSSKAPTLNQEGELVRICGHNAAHTETKAIPSLSTEGAYNATVTKQPTCDQVGITTYSSEAYGSYEAEIPPTGHTFDPDREAYCKVCNKKYYSANLQYDLSADGTYYTVSSGQLTDNNVVIPAVYNGIPVKAIASEGFAYKTWIHSVTIPEYVENIGSGAFNGSGITKVYFNAINCNDFKAKNWVFLVSTNVEVVIGRNVERIPARMFYPLITTDRTVKVTKLTFEQGSVCKSIGDYAFNKTLIAELTLPDSVEAIGEYAFYNTQITNLILGDGIVTLGSSCFGANSKLVNVTFGKSLTVIPDDCFNYCDKLIAVNLSATQVSAIGDDAFKGCFKLSAVVLPDSKYLTIGKQAFLDCSALAELNLGNGLIAIGEQAFANCVSLQSLTLPATLKTLSDGAFANCSSLAEIYFNATNCNDLSVSNMVFANICADGVKVVFGETVVRIPARLFYCSSNLSLLPQISVLQLGANVKDIGAYAFMGVTIGTATYLGAQWSAVVIGSGNSSLINAVK